MRTASPTENDDRAAVQRGSRIKHSGRIAVHAPLRSLVVPPKLPEPISPALVEHAEQRARDVQNRAADQITRFSGSMTFVYLHIIWFASWIGFGVEHYPYGLLTMIVSLEAIFLSTFVMIGQNRQAEFQQAKADHDFVAQEQELKSNTELTRAIHALTTDIHRQVMKSGNG